MNSQKLLNQYTKYLQETGSAEKTIDHLQRWANRFLTWLEDENLTYNQCKYSDLLSLLKKCHSEKKSITYINRYLWGIRRFYNYLVKEGKATYNPAANLRIRGEIKKLPSELLSKEQLEQVYEEYQPKTPVQKRNKVILSLFFYQGLIRQELDNLEPSDINLKKGTILIRKNSRLQRRILKLEAHQILLFQEYLQEVRSKLLELKKKQSDKLLITIGETDKIKEAARELLNELQAKYPELKSFLHVRLSLITHWVDEKNIREAQYMAGHNSIISTQRYLKVNLQDLQEQLRKFHPLK
jgi:site-specific recombinase XerD